MKLPWKTFGIPWVQIAPETLFEETPSKTRVQAILDDLSAYLTDTYGERCAGVDPGCPCCQVWRLYDLVEAMLPDCEGDS